MTSKKAPPQRPDEVQQLRLENDRLYESLRQAQRVHHLYDDSIKQLKQARKKIQKSEALKSAMLDTALDCIISMNHEGRIIEFNPAAEKVFGYARNTVIGEVLADLIIPADLRARHNRGLENALAGKEDVWLNRRMETTAMRADGTLFPVELSLTRISHEGQAVFTGFIRDLSDVAERKRAEAEAHKLLQAIEQAGESILITDRNGVIEYVNTAFITLTGYAAEEVIGQTPRILKSGYQNDDFYEHMWETITRGRVWRGKVTDRKKDGSFFPAKLTISPVFFDDGDGRRCTHFVCLQDDQTEINQLERQFQQAQKMEAVGTLVGGIAHDFNNILAGITGNLYLAKQKVQQQPDVIERLTNVEHLSNHAANMIQQLLTFARKDVVSIRSIPLTPFIKETLKFLRTSVPENIAMHQEICPDSIKINGDPTQLHQVLMNLVNNARDALEGVASPCITTRLEVFDADTAWFEQYEELNPGLYAHLSVADNGCGIPEHQVDHLFEPFFTTKAVGKGTGLGLAMVFGAIKTHHGMVDVESIEGKGSTFHVYIPLLESESVADVTTGEQWVVEGRGETILLVDDNHQVIETGREVLESMGYRVITAIDGQQAVEIFKLRVSEIDLCILDVVMPVMDGHGAAQHIRQMNPKVSIIFATGYDKSMQNQLGDEKVLSKPFSIVEMSQLIRQQLDG